GRGPADLSAAATEPALQQPDTGEGALADRAHPARHHHLAGGDAGMASQVPVAGARLSPPDLLRIHIRLSDLVPAPPGGGNVGAVPYIWNACYGNRGFRGKKCRCGVHPHGLAMAAPADLADPCHLE